MNVTVITATMPGREPLLVDAIASVSAQTVAAEHLIAVDHVRAGGARVYNLLAESVATEWTAILPDDDVLYPFHLERLLAASDAADVVYSWCDTEGADPWTAYNQPFDPATLRRTSSVSHVALVRTDALIDAGGWPDESGYDWRLWVALLDRGARFRCVEEPTWLYRMDAGRWHESRPWLANA